MASIENLIARLAQEGKAVKPAPHPLMLSIKWLGWAVAYLVMALVLSGVRADWMHKLGEPLFLAEIVALVAIFVTALASAAVLAFPDLHQMRRVALLPIASFIMLALTLYIAWQADMPPAPLPKHSYECCLSIMLLGVLPTIGILMQMRKFASTHQRMGACTAMLAAFSMGALWLRLYEPNDSILHVIEWHYLPMLLFTAVGVWLGKRVLKW